METAGARAGGGSLMTTASGIRVRRPQPPGNPPPGAMLIKMSHRSFLEALGGIAVDNQNVTVYIDPETGHVVRSVGRAPAEGFPDGHLEFATNYDDFRSVEGKLFPFGETNFAQGMKTGDTVLEKIHIGAWSGRAPDRT